MSEPTQRTEGSRFGWVEPALSSVSARSASWLGTTRRLPVPPRIPVGLRGLATSPWVEVLPARVVDDQLVITLRTANQVDHLHVSVPEAFDAHPDLVAAAVAPLLHSRHERIRFEFPISPAVREHIARRTGSEVAAEGEVESRRPGSTTALSFSGGFDSLASYLLASDQVKRVAVDFGPWFRRESRFFQTLDPDLVSRTDLRAKGYAGKDWLFMGTVAMLLADHLDLGAIGFGSTFDSSPSYFHAAGWSAASRRQPGNPLFEAVGLREHVTTRGLTFLGTSTVVNSLMPDLVQRSLDSLARNRSEKSFRKRLAVENVKAFQSGSMVNLDAVQLPYRKSKMGISYVADFAMLTFMTLHPPEFIERVVRDVGSGVLDAARRVRPDFLFRYNPMYLEDIQQKFRPTVLSQLSKAGVEMYRDDDWAEYEKFRRILQKSYTLPD